MSNDPFVAQLVELCRAEPARAKWVIVPSHAVGLSLGDRLAREGCDWANLRFVTARRLALDTAAPFLTAQGLDPLPDGLGPSLVMRLLMDLPGSVPSYFRPLADMPRMGASLWASLCELRLAGVTAAILPTAAFEDERKHAELQALLASYEQHLADHRQADGADVYRAAAVHAADSPVAVQDIVVEAPGIRPLPLLAAAFLDTLAGRHLPTAHPFIPGLQPSRRERGFRGWARGGGKFGADETPDAAVRTLAFLLDPAAAATGAAPALEMFHAAGREAEVEGVLRRIVAQTPPRTLDQVEVACASSEYAQLFWEKCQRLDLPVTIEHGIAVTNTRPARALLGLCDWIESDFVAGRLRRLFQAGDIRIEFPDGAGGGQAARLLTRSQATWGRGTYALSLGALPARERGAAADDELEETVRAEAGNKAARVEYLKQWIDDVLRQIPAADDHGAVSLAQLVAALCALLNSGVRCAGPLDAIAVAAIQRALDDLAVLGDLRRPMRHALALVREAIGGFAVGASCAKPGHLHISTLASAGYDGRPCTFIVGLQEGAVFRPLIEDPVLLDVERRALSSSLPTSHDRLEESVFAVLSRLAVLPLATGGKQASVCASYSCRDLREGRETFPSWLMLQMLRVANGDPKLTYDDLRQRLGAPETLVPPSSPQVLTDAAWWLRAAKDAGEQAIEQVLAAFPSLAAGRKAAEARESERFTEWDGLVPAAGAALDPRASGKPVSVTRLEALAACPFRYFVEQGLGVEVLEDADPDHDEWLDPMQRGSALHEIYATLGREARAANRRIDARRDAVRARQIAEAKLAELRAGCPPPSDVVFDRERADFLHDVDLFLEFESERPPSTPVAFEVSFGHDGDGHEQLAQAEPVKIPLGHGQSFLLRGTIDRIDKLPDGSYEIIDYKAGRYYPDKWKGTFRQGSMLQHALYGLAASQLLRRIDARPRVARGVYEFPSARGGGERVPIDPPGNARLAQVLSDLFDAIAEGAFVPADSDKNCGYCDFSRACGMPNAQAKAKLENSKNARLQAYLRLRTHE